MKLLLYLILVHLIADFILQDDKLAKSKTDFYKNGRKKLSFKNPLIIHGVSIFITMQVLHLFFSPWENILVLSILITLIHILIDHIKLVNTQSKGRKGMLFFLMDQFIHLISIYFLGSIFSINYQEKYLNLIGNYITSFKASQIKIPNLSENTLICIIIFIAFSIISGYIISYILEEYQAVIEEREGEKSNNQVQKTNKVSGSISEKEKKLGIRIGIIERMLIIIFVASVQFGALGLILAGKSLARFEELKNKKFAEYYLLGTLCSFLFGVAGGLIIQVVK